MSDDRTQAPSRARREAARAQGVAPQSRILTSAVGLLAGVVIVTCVAGSIVPAVVGHLRVALRDAGGAHDPQDVERFAGLLKASAGPYAPYALAAAGVFVACIAVHALQTGGVWAPGRLAPSLGGLWSLSAHDDEREPGAVLLKGAARGASHFVRALAVVTASGAVLFINRNLWMNTALMDLPTLVRASGHVLFFASLSAALTLVALGVVDYLIQRARFERMLRLTPDQYRAEQKAVEGDPAVRSRRMQLARSWLRDPGEVLAGTSLVVTGDAGLTVLLAGSGPPGRVTVRTIARGIAASSLRHGAERGGIPVVRAAALARWFAASRARSKPLPPKLAEELARLWVSPRAPSLVKARSKS